MRDPPGTIGYDDRDALSMLKALNTYNKVGVDELNGDSLFLVFFGQRLAPKGEESL